MRAQSGPALRLTALFSVTFDNVEYQPLTPFITLEDTLLFSE